MPITFTKTKSQRGSYPEATHIQHFMIFDGSETLFAEMRIENDVNASILVLGDQYFIQPSYRLLMPDKYLVLKDNLAVAHIVFPKWWLLRPFIKIYGEGIWHFEKFQAHFLPSKTKKGFFVIDRSLEIKNPNPVFIPLYLFLWQFPRARYR